MELSENEHRRRSRRGIVRTHSKSNNAYSQTTALEQRLVVQEEITLLVRRRVIPIERIEW